MLIFVYAFIGIGLLGFFPEILQTLKENLFSYLFSLVLSTAIFRGVMQLRYGTEESKKLLADVFAEFSFVVSWFVPKVVFFGGIYCVVSGSLGTLQGIRKGEPILSSAIGSVISPDLHLVQDLQNALLLIFIFPMLAISLHFVVSLGRVALGYEQLDERSFEEELNRGAQISDVDRVMRLNAVQQLRGFKPGWLYYECERLGLLHALREARSLGLVSDGEGYSRNGSQNSTKGRRTHDQDSAGQTGSAGKSFDPYKILGVQRHASSDEIKKSYRRLARQYHPDRVADLGPELIAQANQKFKEIRRAYDELQGLGKVA